MATLPETRRSTYGVGPHTSDHDIIHDVVNIILDQGNVGQVLAKTSAANPESSTGARVGYISIPNASDFLPVSGGAMIGNLSLGNNRITALALPVNITDAVNKQYVDEALAREISGTPKYVTATTTTTLRPVWSGPVVWRVLYTPFTNPVNAIDGDHVINAAGA